MNQLNLLLMATFFTSQAVLATQPAMVLPPTPSVSQQLELAHSLEQKGLIKKSLTTVQAIAKHSSTNDQITLALGRLLIKNGQANKAIDVLQPLVLEHSNDWRPWFWVGTALLLKKDYIGAGFHMDEALAREGKNVSIWVQRAVIEQARGNSSSAINILEVANSLETNRADVLLNLAYNYELDNNNKNAEHYFRQFLFVSTQSQRYARLRSEVIYRLAQYK